jgi:hypothetical protein
VGQCEFKMTHYRILDLRLSIRSALTRPLSIQCPYISSTRLRIWGSEVRILPGAPTLSLLCSKPVRNPVRNPIFCFRSREDRSPLRQLQTASTPICGVCNRRNIWMHKAAVCRADPAVLGVARYLDGLLRIVAHEIVVGEPVPVLQHDPNPPSRQPAQCHPGSARPLDRRQGHQGSDRRVGYLFGRRREGRVPARAGDQCACPKFICGATPVQASCWWQ